MIQIAKEVEENPGVVLDAPHTTVIGRLDEVQAARQPILRYIKEKAVNKETVMS
jgi:glycine dehydrogenase subunit 2